MPNGSGPLDSKSYSQQFDFAVIKCKTFRQKAIKNQEFSGSLQILSFPLGHTRQVGACVTMR